MYLTKVMNIDYFRCLETYFRKSRSCVEYNVNLNNDFDYEILLNVKKEGAKGSKTNSDVSECQEGKACFTE